MTVGTGVYELLLKFLQKNSPHNVRMKGGGGFLNNVKKLHFSCTKASLIQFDLPASINEAALFLIFFSLSLTKVKVDFWTKRH